MDSASLGMLLVLFALIVIYIGGRYYLRESFEDKLTQKPGKDLEKVGSDTRQEAVENAPDVFDTSAVRADYMPDRAYIENPILSVDDYEYSVVFQNEGSREVGKAQISDAMSRYPLDWSNRPPSDEKFQNYREAFIDQMKKDQEGPAVNTEEFNSISGADGVPPNTEAMDEEERKLLAMYKPEEAQNLTTYSLKDAVRLVRRLYERKGLIPDIVQSEQGPNVFEIIEVKEKHPKIIWEDEVDQDVQRDKLRGEQTIEVPQVVNDLAAGLDPWFEPRTRTRMDRHDYTKWTPGLERSFAPTYPVKSWY